MIRNNIRMKLNEAYLDAALSEGVYVNSAELDAVVKRAIEINLKYFQTADIPKDEQDKVLKKLNYLNEDSSRIDLLCFDPNSVLAKKFIGAGTLAFHYNRYGKDEIFFNKKILECIPYSELLHAMVHETIHAAYDDVEAGFRTEGRAQFHTRNALAKEKARTLEKDILINDVYFIDSVCHVILSYLEKMDQSFDTNLKYTDVYEFASFAFRNGYVDEKYFSMAQNNIVIECCMKIAGKLIELPHEDRIPILERLVEEFDCFGEENKSIFKSMIMGVADYSLENIKFYKKELELDLQELESIKKSLTRGIISKKINSARTSVGNKLKAISGKLKSIRSRFSINDILKR